MATTLAAQLVKIRAESTNSHDLKAQKKAHSQSLLFEPGIAATQDFDLVYEICLQGFEDLCRLDTRFTQFASSIFSEQSKEEDRTQMTAAQNQQLDAVLEDFLNLVGGRLLLKPAVKAVEWLIRRFRIHENNTLHFLVTFLPYHTTAMFPTVLSLLPATLPPALKFLHPYVQSLVNPPRHAIVYTASHNQAFFTTLNVYVLKALRLSYEYPTLVSFWASIAAEAVAAMLDHARSSRRESHKQNQEDVLLFILPVINEILSVRGIPDFKVGCYMVLTILASKADLDDGSITAMMEAVTMDWAQTSHAGLICLSVLAEKREIDRLPRKVHKAVIALENLDDDLKTLQKQYRVNRLTLSMILGILDTINKTQDPSGLRLVTTLMEADLMDEASIEYAARSIMLASRSLRQDPKSSLDIRASLTDIVLHLAESQSIGRLFKANMNEVLGERNDFSLMLQQMIGSDAVAQEQIDDDVVVRNEGEKGAIEPFEDLISHISTRTTDEVSFLSHSESDVFDSLAHAFSSTSANDATVKKFADLPVLRKSLAMTEPLFFSFYIRFWCGNHPAKARAVALRVVSDCIAREPLIADVQILVPYLIYALADPSAVVRRAATELVTDLSQAYGEAVNAPKDISLPILGEGSMYGQGKETNGLSWLFLKENRRFMDSVLVPGLRECLLDQGHVSQLLSDNLNGSKHSSKSNTLSKELKKSYRLPIFKCLCSHVVNMPLLNVRFRLLPMLNQVTKVGDITRTKLLMPILSQCSGLGEEEYRRVCQQRELEPSQHLDQIVSIVTPDDRHGIMYLREIVESGVRPSFPSLKLAALRRLQHVWPSLNSDIQSTIANALLQQAINELTDDEARNQEIETTETLRSLALSTTILQSFIESLPSFSLPSQDRPSASKKRRISQGQPIDGISNPKLFSTAIKQTTLVLELVGDSKAARHPVLLKSLFRVLSDLQQSQNKLKATVDYLTILTIDSVLAIVEETEVSTSSNIDHSAIRINILIDCVRTTTSPQVRNSALLLVAALATVTPELVLHSIMPVFTFMGANVLRQDDDFSAYVVKQTMESVIPRLVQSLHKRKGGPFNGVCELLLSFAAAFKHVPMPRRLQLFTSLANKVGPPEYLFALLTILIDKFPEDRKVLQFGADLCNAYDVNVRLQTIVNFLDVILDAQQQKPSISMPLLMMSKDRNLESTTANLLQLPLVVLNNQDLISKIQRKLNRGGNEAASIRDSYAQMIEKLFLLSDKCKGTERLGVLCMQALDTSLGLLPMPDLVGALQDLLGRTEDHVPRQVLRSFEHRLERIKGAGETTRNACLSFFPQLLSIIQESSDVSLKKSAIGSVDKITEKFGKMAIPTVIESALAISNDNCVAAAEISTRVVSLLCLATMVEVAGDSFVSVIPTAFPKALDSIALSIQEGTHDSDLHDAAYTFFSALLLYVPWFISGADLDRFLAVSYESINAELGDDCGSRRIEAMQLISKQTEAKECFAALSRTWPSAMTEGPLAVKEYIGMLRLAIDHHPKSIIVKQSDSLGDLLMRILDLRRIQLSSPDEDSYGIDEIEEVERAVNDTTIAMIYKLNDATFRPLFIKLIEWTALPESSDEKARMQRQTSWYTFLLTFFGTLKSIVTSYAGFILDDSVEVLDKTIAEDNDSLNLWKQVVLTLHKTFEHDQDDFYQSPNHFTSVSTALLSQIPKAAHIPLQPELIPAIAELAVATDSATHHKEMNTAILQHMRSDIPAVRLSAVQCERALTDRLGEEWLALLPEMLPFISEALEDDDETVEREVQKWVKGIEGILGESLNPMLQ